MTAPQEGAAPARRRRRWLRIVAVVLGTPVVLIAAMVGRALYLDGKPRLDLLRPGTISGMEWSREIVLLRPQWVEHEGWSHPDSAEVVATERRAFDTTLVHMGYDTVQREKYTPHYRLRGRRLLRLPSTRDTVSDVYELFRVDTTYAPWYRYRVSEWIASDTLIARASTRRGTWREPAWPVVPAGVEEYARNEYYAFYVSVDGREETEFSGNPEGYAHLRPGDRVAWYYGYLFSRDSLPACRRWHRGRGDPPPDSLGCSPRRTTAR